MLVPISALLVQSNEPPLHLPAVEALADGTYIDERPIEVEPLGLGLFRIRNGRHRFVAALARGDQHVEAEIRRSDGRGT